MKQRIITGLSASSIVLLFTLHRSTLFVLGIVTISICTDEYNRCVAKGLPARFLTFQERLVSTLLNGGIMIAALFGYEAMSFALFIVALYRLIEAMIAVSYRPATSSHVANPEHQSSSSTNTPVTSPRVVTRRFRVVPTPAAPVDMSSRQGDASTPPEVTGLDPEDFKLLTIQIFGHWYLAWLFAHAVLLLCMPNGIALIIYTAVCIFNGDNGGLCGGKCFRKKAAMPKISPNKTVMGCICQITWCTLTSMVIPHAAQFLFNTKLPFSQLDTILLGALLGIMGIIGDAVESFIKRCFHTKDMGSMLPAVGGLLDRVDGLIFGVVTTYYYLRVRFPELTNEIR